MNAELLVIEGCPNAAAAEALFADALALADVEGVDVATRVIRTRDEAEAARFAGSPSFMLDGADLFPVPASDFNLACRVYPTSAGFRGLPEVTTLSVAVSTARNATVSDER